MSNIQPEDQRKQTFYEYEAALIGCVLQTPESIKALNIEGLSPRCFMFTYHREIYSKILEIYEEKLNVEIADLVGLPIKNSDFNDMFEYGQECIKACIVSDKQQALEYAKLVKNEAKRRLLHSVIREADLLMDEYSPDELIEILKHAFEEDVFTNSNEIGFALTFDQVMSLPSAEYLIKGILDVGGSSVVYGDSNTGKTFAALDISMHIALGMEWQSRRVKGGPILYVATEGGLGLKERLEAFKRHHELVSVTPAAKFITKAVDLVSDQRDAFRIIHVAEDMERPELIVIDTVHRAMAGGDENSSADMGAFIKNVELIRARTGAHVMLIHHSGKDASKGARGHSSLRAAVDTEIQITNDEGVISADIKKQRDGEKGKRISWQLKPVKVGIDSDGDDKFSCVLEPVEANAMKNTRKMSDQQKRALDVLRDLIIETGEKKVPKSGMPAQQVVRTEQFSTALFDANISAATDAHQKKSSIKRTIERLNDRGITATWKHYIWIV